MAHWVLSNTPVAQISRWRYDDEHVALIMESELLDVSLMFCICFVSVLFLFCFCQHSVL